MSGSVAQQLVELVHGITHDELPRRTREAAVRNSIHLFGIARLGLQNPTVRAAVTYVVENEAGTSATVVGHGSACGSPAGAAFANAVAIHGDFREDTHAASSSHPGAVVMPAVLAAAEHLGRPLAPGRYLEAVIAGHEVIGRLGRAGAHGTIGRGFRAPSVFPVFGGAVAAGLVLGLTTDELVDALAIAAQGASGVNHPFLAGTDEWFLAPALAARHGVMSALLAAAGIHGSRRSLEGEDGVLSAFAGGGTEVDLRPSGHRPYEMERAHLKSSLTCGWNQSLVHQLAQSGVDSEQVREVRVRMSPIAAEYPGVAKQAGFTTRSEALLSAPFAVALQLERGSLDHSGYSMLNDRSLLAIASRVEVTTDGRLDGYSTAIEIDLDDGRTVRSEDTDDPPGFALASEEVVLANLRRITESAGLDVDHVELLSAGVASLVKGGDTRLLAQALGEAVS